MPVPKKRVSRSVRNMRRSHDRIIATQAVTTCAACGSTRLSHHVCPSCGTYNGRKVFSDVDTGASAEDAS